MLVTESSELHAKVEKILQRVESIDNFMPWIIRPQAKQILEEMLAWFSKQTSAARVYLEVDEKMTVTAIGTKLGMKQPNVSREIGKLRDLGLIEQKTVGNSTIYAKTKIDRVLGLTKALKWMLGNSSKPDSDNNEQATSGNKSSV